MTQGWNGHAQLASRMEATLITSSRLLNQRMDPAMAGCRLHNQMLQIGRTGNPRMLQVHLELKESQYLHGRAQIIDSGR
jgi:hypothetical protein